MYALQECLQFLSLWTRIFLRIHWHCILPFLFVGAPGGLEGGAIAADDDPKVRFIFFLAGCVLSGFTYSE